MKRYRLEVSITVEIDSFTEGDAVEALHDNMCDLVDMAVVETTVDSIESVW